MLSGLTANRKKDMAGGQRWQPGVAA